jgi:hypothetical protein
VKISAIKAIQQKIGVDPDGAWGPESIKAAQKYLLDLMPQPHPFPTRQNIESFYGPPGKPPTYRIRLPFPLYSGRNEITFLHPHEKCADSLLRVFENLAEIYPTHQARRDAGILVYNELYNPRKTKSSSSWSAHAWAIALDLDCDFNGTYTHWPARATMPFAVMECFAREGWLPAGPFWSRNAMHFQATQ